MSVERFFLPSFRRSQMGVAGRRISCGCACARAVSGAWMRSICALLTMVDGLLARCSLARLSLCPSISLNRRFQEPQRASECLSGTGTGSGWAGRAWRGGSASGGSRGRGLELGAVSLRWQGSDVRGVQGQHWGAGRSSSAKCQTSVSGARRGGGGSARGDGWAKEKRRKR